MCSAISVLGNIGTDHDGFHSSPVIAASPDVFLDGKPVARQGDQLAPHGKPIAVTGTAIGCGGVVIGSGSGQAG